MNDKYVIVSPCFNESDVISKFLDEIESKLTKTNNTFIVLVVDDCSNDSTLEILTQYQFKSKQFELKIISLNHNMGHQEAIRQGLNYAKKNSEDIRGVFVMDSDGEDDPAAIVELVKIKNFDIIFVKRGKRKENTGFKIGYFFYKIIFKLITGKTISFGNYSLISPKVLTAISSQSFTHYAGFLSKQRFDIQEFQFDRQNRIDGKSKMSYKNLVFHGLNSLIEYAEEILFSLIKLFFITLVALSFLIGFVLYSKFVSHKAIDGWASSIGSNLMLSALIIISTIILGLLLLSIKKTINQKNEQYHEVN